MESDGIQSHRRRRPHLKLQSIKNPSTLKVPSFPPNSSTSEVQLVQLCINGKIYKFTAEDLEDKDLLGVGDYGEVVKMWHSKTNTMMAVKKLFATFDDRTEAKLKIMTESSGVCPFIIDFYGGLQLFTNSELWICTELMDSSMDIISERVYNELKKRIPEEVLGMMTVAVIEALSYLYYEIKIFHRNIKPSQILLNKMGEFKLCDCVTFEFKETTPATTISSDRKTYMAPERINPSGNSKYTIQSDVWSIGITLLELALGSYPFSSSSGFEMLFAIVKKPPPNLPNDGRYSKEFQKFISACLTKESTERPSYRELQKYKFFKLYYMAEVDVGMWLQSIMDPTH